MDLNRLAAEGIVLAPAQELPPYNPVAARAGAFPPYLDKPAYVPQPPEPSGAGRDPADPPIFLLQAAPTFAPWLPDTQFQRVPIGVTGQVLAVQADGSIAWVTGAGGGFTNPMTTLGDLITGGAAGAPVRLTVGSNGQVLVVSAGVPAWTGGVLVNPMTAQDDLIVGGAAGAAGRLAVGPAGSFLSVSLSGHAVWNGGPMNTVGDMMYASSPVAAPARIPIGSNGQVLTIVAGVPTWQNASSGFTNPMSAAGDLIIGLAGGAASRLGVGAAGQVLGVSGGLPAWQTPGTAPPVPFAVVQPSGDTTGVTDAAAIVAAEQSLVPGGGLVMLGRGDFYVTVPAAPLSVPGITGPSNACIWLPQQTTPGTTGGGPISLVGQGEDATTVHVVGANVIGVHAHRSSGYGIQFSLNPADRMAGSIRDLTISGQNPTGTQTATGASIGADCGDGWGFVLERVACANFTGTNAIGLSVALRVFWCEKQRYQANLLNNTRQCQIWSPIADGTHHSMEYNVFDFTIFCNLDQDGVAVQNGMNCGGCQFWIKGNMQLTSSSTSVPTNNIAALSFTGNDGAGDNSRLYYGQIWLKVEGNPGQGGGSGNAQPYGIYSDGQGYVRESMGFIGHSLTDSNLNGAEFSFTGGLGGDPNLAQGWPSTAFPGYGNAWTNNGPDANVCVSGGSGPGVSGISVNGIATGLTTGAFFIRAKGAITVNGSGVAPAFNVVPAAQMV